MRNLNFSAKKNLPVMIFYAKIQIEIIFNLLQSQCLKITKSVALDFFILALSTNFCPVELAGLVTLFDRKLQVFINSPK